MRREDNYMGKRVSNMVMDGKRKRGRPNIFCVFGLNIPGYLSG
jgi:hypothetical protein